MATYNQISIVTVDSLAEVAQPNRYELRLLERDGLADTLPFDFSGEITIIVGNNEDEHIKGIKPAQVQFLVKTQSALADKLINAEHRQLKLEIREVHSNKIKFEGYVKPDYHRYTIYRAVKHVQFVATGALADLAIPDATIDKKTLDTIYSSINDDLELTRQTDYYMRTRYNGQALSDPIPQRIWMTELGKLGKDSGKRYDAIQQISQEFNFQVFQHEGRLVVADVYERFKNPQAVNVYRAGATQETEDVLVTLDETNVIDKIEDDEAGPTGQKATRIGRVVQQRRLPQREQLTFPTQTLPSPLSTTPKEIVYPGDFVGGDIVKVDTIEGTADISPGYQPSEFPSVITVNFEILQFAFLDKDTQETLYYDFIEREWSTIEKWGNVLHQFFELPESQQTGGRHYSIFTWTFADFELAPIPDGRRGSVTIKLKEDYTITQPGVSVDPGYMDTKLTAFNVPITFNDTPDDLYHQAITTNSPGETRVYPLYESDVTEYSGTEGTMFIGDSVFTAVEANNEWIEEGTANLVSFIELIARRKAELLLGTADRIHLIVRDTTPISMLNICLFQGKYYAPTCIKKQLISGYQEVWMKPAPGLEYTYDSKFTYDPEELTGSNNGPSRTWVTNRIYDSFATSLATGAIAKTTATTGSGLVTAFQIDRQNLLVTGDEIFIVDQFTLSIYEFVVSADQGASYTLPVQPKSIPTPIPKGSLVFSNMRAVITGVLQSQYAFQVTSRSSAIGVLTEDVSGLVDTLPNVNLWGYVRKNWMLDLLVNDRPEPPVVQVAGDQEQYDAGIQDLPIAEQIVDAPAGTPIRVNGTFLTSILHVDPGQLKAMVEREKKADAIGTLSADRSGSGVTTIALQDIDEDVQLDDGQKLRIINKEGRNEEIIVSGDQLLVAPSDTLNIVSKTLINTYAAGYAWVREPVSKITGRLNITAGLTLLNQQNTQDNSDAIAGLTLDVQGNDSAIATLQARVTTTESDITGLEEEDTQLNAAILQLEADLNSATASLTTSIDILEDDTRTIIRSNSAPTQRPSGDPLQAGDLWIETDDNDEAHQWDGNSWEPFDGKIKSQVAGLILQVGDFDTTDFQQFEDQIGTIGARTVLFAKSDGNIAKIDLLSGSVGAVIDISADQVNINGVVFDEGAGLIRSSDFNEANETGWRIVGGSNSFMQIYNIEVWGTLKTVDLEEEMVIQGALYMPSKSNPDIILSPSQGLRIKGGSAWANQRAINFYNPSFSTVDAKIWFATTGDTGLYLETTFGYVNIEGDLGVRLKSDVGGNYINILDNGNTVLANPSGDIKMLSVPSFNPGTDIVHTRLGSQIQSGTRVLCLG